eukprot:Hpha_TRINITY_DN16560_c2_g1::TRINITY_DN16560_c2_g1_i1::g.133681::m.133681
MVALLPLLQAHGALHLPGLLRRSEGGLEDIGQDRVQCLDVLLGNPILLVPLHDLDELPPPYFFRREDLLTAAVPDAATDHTPDDQPHEDQNRTGREVQHASDNEANTGPDQRTAANGLPVVPYPGLKLLEERGEAVGGLDVPLNGAHYQGEHRLVGLRVDFCIVCGKESDMHQQKLPRKLCDRQQPLATLDRRIEIILLPFARLLVCGADTLNVLLQLRGHPAHLLDEGVRRLPTVVRHCRHGAAKGVCARKCLEGGRECTSQDTPHAQQCAVTRSLGSEPLLVGTGEHPEGLIYPQGGGGGGDM